MNDFVALVLILLEQSFLLAAAVMLITALILADIYQKYRDQGKTASFSRRKAGLILLLAGYGAVVVYITLLRGPGGEYRYVNVQLFQAWRQAWASVSPRGWLNILLNVMLFLPLGFLLPQLSDLFQRWNFTLTVGLAVSLVIELLQLITGAGIFDVDDLTANFAGTALGFCIVKALDSISGQSLGHMKKSALWLFPPVAFLLLLLAGGIGIYSHALGETEHSEELSAPVVRSLASFQQTGDRSDESRS